MAVSKFGPVDTKQEHAAVQLYRRQPFASAQPKEDGVLLSVYSKTRIKSPRILKVCHVEDGLLHCQLLLRSPADLDEEAIGWLQSSYNEIGRRAPS